MTKIIGTGRARGRGRPAGGTDTREQILVAARAAFAERGYDGATLRAIAAAADVDAALVHHYFGTKEGLFVEAVRFPVRPSDLLTTVLAGGVDQLGDRVARTFLGIAGDPATRPALLALIRSATSHPQRAALLGEFISRGPLGHLAGQLTGVDARLRVELAVAQMIGVILQRYVLRLEPIASLTDDELVAYLGPALQRYFTPPGPAR